MTKEQQEKIDEICEELGDALYEAGLEIDHYGWFLSLVREIETEEIVGALHGADVMIDWEE